ncbi:MAG: FAD-dependent oxidoreductase [Actinobacteria bacterium]|nr:FAD-dependent oxidoreductase [Actinomycetota bacterium]
MQERVAIVGSGLGGLVAYAMLRHAGIEPGEIAVFGENPDPVAAWRPRAAAIRQRRMRSESDGHCLPRSFPGLAVRESLRRLTPVPLVLSVCDRYRPNVSDFLAHVEEVRVRSGWDTSFLPARVERVQAVERGFELNGHGVFRHVLLAPGHPGHALPPDLEGDPRVVHAYEPHDYARSVAVVGAGMAAATEWMNALAAGSEVVSVRRREPARRPLNVDRTLFSKRGLAGFHATAAAERAELLRRLSEPSYPPGRAWDEPIERATRAGRFTVAAELNGAEQVICATGFRRGFQHDPLLQRLADEHELETAERWLVLADDATVPSLTAATHTLALAGVPAQWAYPAADTLVGMKYVARRFVRRVVRCPSR